MPHLEVTAVTATLGVFVAAVAHADLGTVEFAVLPVAIGLPVAAASAAFAERDGSWWFRHRYGGSLQERVRLDQGPSLSYERTSASAGGDHARHRLGR